jgi:hypothetical protein
VSEGPVTVFRSTEEAVYLPLVAALNSAGIPARAMDTAQTGLRWDIQIISPTEVWVPGTHAAEARAFVADWEDVHRTRSTEEEDTGEPASESEFDATTTHQGGLWRAICWGLLVVIVFMHLLLIPFALVGVAVVEGLLWYRRRAPSVPHG